MKAYLLILERQTYDGGDIPLFIMLDKKQARSAANTMNRFIVRVYKKTPLYPDADVSESKWDACQAKRDSAKEWASTRWPFGIDLFQEATYNREDKSIQVRELELKTKQDEK